MFTTKIYSCQVLILQSTYDIFMFMDQQKPLNFKEAWEYMDKIGIPIEYITEEQLNTPIEIVKPFSCVDDIPEIDDLI